MKFAIVALICAALCACTSTQSKLIEIAPAYSSTSVNTAIFRANSVTSHNGWQYASFYDPDGTIILAKRKHGSDKWQIQATQYKGNAADAHNVISIGIDGDGYVHAAFDHHGHQLKYCKSIAPGSLILSDMLPMIGRDEDNVTYPEFYNLPNGDLLFAYRDGQSGRGNLVLNRYDLANGKWQRVQDVLIDGENERNAYWQLCVDPNGILHVSWVWRETWLVETNHDLCYARSADGGISWEKSDGTPYSLPITASNAEYAWRIPQNSELINQTSMATDQEGHPFITTYWRDQNSDVPQYRLVWHDGDKWQQNQVGCRKMPFSLSGGGTKMIPIARPRIAIDGNKAYYLMRDQERGSKVTLAISRSKGQGEWEMRDLTAESVDAWEPTYDIALWHDKKQLHAFVQATRQGDGEKVLEGSPTPACILEVALP